MMTIVGRAREEQVFTCESANMREYDKRYPMEENVGRLVNT